MDLSAQRIKDKSNQQLTLPSRRRHRMRRIPNKHTPIAAPARKIRHIKNRIDIIDIRLF